MRLIDRQKWTRAYERHVPNQNVEQLGQFIKPSCAKRGTDNREPVKISHTIAVVIMSKAHGAELEDAHWSTGLAWALLPEQERTTDIDPDGQRHQNHDRPKDDQKDCRKRYIEKAFAEAIKALWCRNDRRAIGCNLAVLIGKRGGFRRRPPLREAEAIGEEIDRDALVRLQRSKA
jgi:hypothetical protein